MRVDKGGWMGSCRWGGRIKKLWWERSDGRAASEGGDGGGERQVW